jgi:hypothetical protein
MVRLVAQGKGKRNVLAKFADFCLREFFHLESKNKEVDNRKRKKIINTNNKKDHANKAYVLDIVRRITECLEDLGQQLLAHLVLVVSDKREKSARKRDGERYLLLH